MEQAAPPVRPLRDFEPGSRHAYNAIGYTCLASITDLVREVAELPTGVPLRGNLPLILFSALHVDVCDHYVHEYERCFDLKLPADVPGLPPKEWPSPGINSLRKRLFAFVERLADNYPLQGKVRVGYVGFSTFSWSSLSAELRDFGIRAEPVRGKRPLTIPCQREQVAAVERWRQKLHHQMRAIFGGALEEPVSPPADHPKRLIADVEALRVEWDEPLDLLMTGTLGKWPTRAFAFHAQSQGIPVLTLFHGAHHQIFDEPYHALHEDALPDIKMVYGSPSAQRDLGVLPHEVNLNGQAIRHYARTDPLVEATYQGKSIVPFRSLERARIVYVANYCTGKRYGPYRDVHPATYLAWQERLLDWLHGEAGVRPRVRLHPKRGTTRYDPPGYESVQGSMADVLAAADAFVIDYPTTPFAYVAATDKPVLFFDVGLRRINASALAVVRERFHYASVDMMSPASGFDAMRRDLTRPLSDAFTPVFSKAPSSRSEPRGVAEAIADYLYQWRNARMES